ncbi:glutamate 5-kinase [Asticcacaulis sp. BYS171W]|uniref:Glutamate 5-kinase n=1 Tax=Asticcacaulis aquaticus TaxID=2984212 RepID=A0ABT5HR92_9CAUL|nr:glutamate 5-kinase [Asticcacaulis aquaticus]MDC7682587.1 glutamate 5-kinase [Asticcacaulis aquaticus]
MALSGTKSVFPAHLAAAKRVTLKIGSALVVDPATGAADMAWLRGLAADVAALREAGAEVMIVSSGAGALGRRYLGLKTRNLPLDKKQAAAAAGQPILMRAWDEVFSEHGIKVAQVLLTREDTERRRRWLNARETADTLLKLGVVPIVNENDTVATEEIKYGDNDRLAARAAMLVRAEALVLLSDIDGLYTADPRNDPSAEHIAVVEAITPDIEAMAGGANASAGVGTGGMATKIAAARIAGSAGCSTTIMNGQAIRPLSKLADGARFTLFTAQGSSGAAYKAWIAGTVVPAGQIHIDAGAAKALTTGKSLLPSGISAVTGIFDKGDSIAILSDGREVARGIAAYGSDDIAQIKGRASKDIEAILGYTSGDVVIHRDDMVMV